MCGASPDMFTYWPIGQEESMRFRLSGAVLTFVSLALLAATARAGDDSQKGQGKGKRAEARKSK